jgi:antitoxin VapB
METARRAAVFRNGRNQAVRIPREFELPGREVTIHREGTRLVLEPVQEKRGLLEVLRSLPPLPEHEQLPEIPDYPPEPVDL